MAAACLTVAGGFLAVSAAPVFAIVIFGMALGGVGEGLWEITQNSLIQRVTPDGIRSRVFAASTAAMQVTIALGLLASGAVTAAFGASGAFAVAGAAALGATLILVLDGALAARRQSGHAPAAAQAAAKRRHRPRSPAPQAFDRVREGTARSASPLRERRWPSPQSARGLQPGMRPIPQQ